LVISVVERPSLPADACCISPKKMAHVLAALEVTGALRAFFLSSRRSSVSFSSAVNTFFTRLGFGAAFFATFFFAGFLAAVFFTFVFFIVVFLAAVVLVAAFALGLAAVVVFLAVFFAAGFFATAAFTTFFTVAVGSVSAAAAAVAYERRNWTIRGLYARGMMRTAAVDAPSRDETLRATQRASGGRSCVDVLLHRESTRANMAAGRKLAMRDVVGSETDNGSSFSGQLGIDRSAMMSGEA
jgi:hypothetical protein